MVVYVVIGHESDLFGYNPYDYVIGVYTNSINAETVAKLRCKHYSIEEFYLDDEELDLNSETGRMFLDRWNKIVQPYEDKTAYDPMLKRYKVRCSVCDFELVNMERFCPYCGQRLAQKSAKEKEFIAGA